MMKFIKHYSLEIYTVISMALIVVAALMGDLSFIQKTMTLMVGINYTDMPKYVKAQWNRKN